MNLHGEVAKQFPMTYWRRSHSVAFPGQSTQSQERVDGALRMCRNALQRDGVLFREIAISAREVVRQQLEEQVAIHMAVEEHCAQQAGGKRKRQCVEFGSVEAPINVDAFVAWIDLCVDMSA